MPGLIGILVIISIYFIMQITFTVKGMILAHKLTACIYWFIIGFWDIITSVYFEFSNPKYQVGVGICFCIVGIIYFTVNVVSEYYKKKDAYARLSDHQ